MSATGKPVSQASAMSGSAPRTWRDWAAYGANFLGLQRVDKSRSSMAFRMDDRKQRLVVDADGGQGIGFFGWEVADAARSRRSRRGSKRWAPRSLAARARWPTSATSGPDRHQRSRRQPAGILPWRGQRLRSVQARPQHFRFPHRPARHGPRGDALRAHRRGDEILPGGAGVQAQRLLAAAVPRLLLPRQSAPSLDRAGRDRQEHGPSHDDGAVQLR